MSEDIPLNLDDDDDEEENDDIPVHLLNEAESFNSDQPPKPELVTPTLPTPPKRRGRPRKKDPDDPKPGPRAAPIRRDHSDKLRAETKMAMDLDEFFNQWDWESGEFSCSISRIMPKAWHQRNCEGHVAEVYERLTEETIKEKWGGGTYDLVVKGPNPKLGHSRSHLGSRRVKIEGDPKFPADSMLDYKEAMSFHEAPRGSGNGGSSEDPGMVRMAWKTMADQLTVKSREADKLRARLLDSATRNRDGVTDDQVIALIKENAEKAIQAEREKRKDFEAMMAMVSSQRGGVPPEILQSLSNQHRAELAQLTEAHKMQLSQEREKHDREVQALREGHSREVETLRSDMQARLDREREHGKKDEGREREHYERRIEAERSDAKRERQDLLNQHNLDRESLIKQHQMQLEHVKSIHESQLTTLRSELEARLEMQKSSFQARIDSLTSELDRVRRDLTVAETKVSQTGDIASQAMQLKKVSDALTGLFNPNAGLATVDDDDEKETPKGLGGLLSSLAGSDFGKSILETVVRAATGAPPMPGPAQQPAGPYGAPPAYSTMPSAPYAYQPYPNPSFSGGDDSGYQQYEAVDEEEDEEGETEGMPVQASGSEAVASDEKKSSESSAGQQQSSQPTQVSSESVEQAKMLFQGLETAMANGEDPQRVVDMISGVVPRDNLDQLGNMPEPEIAAAISHVMPESPLLSYSGKKYISQLQEAIKAIPPAAQ